MMPILLAQDETISIDPNAAGAVATGIVGAWIFFWIVIAIVVLVGFILWLWAIIDCSKRQFTNPSDKNTWLIVLIVGFVLGLHLIAAIIYLVAGRKKGTVGGGGQSQTPPSQPASQ